MASLQDIFKQSCELYNSLADFLEGLYDSWKSEVDFKFSKDDLMANYDHYIQCYLLKIALADREFDRMELQYIQKLVRYNNFLDIEAADNDFSMRQSLAKWADKGLADVPMFAVFMDVLEGAHPHGEGTNWPRVLFDSLVQLGAGVMLMDSDLEEAETEDGIDALHAILDYYTEKGYKLTD